MDFSPEAPAAIRSVRMPPVMGVMAVMAARPEMVGLVAQSSSSRPLVALRLMAQSTRALGSAEYRTAAASVPALGGMATPRPAMAVMPDLWAVVVLAERFN